MNEQQYWYIYQNNQQLGPFNNTQLVQLLSSNMIAQNAYLFKVGWKDWRPMEDCYEELGMPRISAEATPKRRKGAPRASIAGRVIVHNNGQLIIGSGVNISSTGIFVETKENIFNLGEVLKLSVKCDGIKKPFNVTARVIRYNTDPKYPIGYGLKFEVIDEEIRKEIERLIANLNQVPSLNTQNA